MSGKTSKVYISVDETTRAARPRLATSEWTTTTGADRAIVTAPRKEAASCKDVLERRRVDADLKYAAVKPVLEGIIIREMKIRG